MKRIALYLTSRKEDARWDALAEFVPENYPAGDYLFDPEESDDDDG